MKAVVVFTNRGQRKLFAEGGSQAWKLNPERVRKLTYLVCVQNRNDGDWGQPDHEQGEAFLIAKISNVEVSPESETGHRFIIRFDEYAEISIPDFWAKLGGLRNPIHYLNDLQTYLDPDTLHWKRRPTDGEGPPRAVPTAPPADRGMDITEAKTALSLFYRVSVSNIEIVIRG